MDFYSNTKPKLFSGELRENINKVVENSEKVTMVNDHITNFIITLFNSTIKPNFALLIILCLAGVFLYYRYNKLKNKKNKNINNNDDYEKKNTIKNIKKEVTNKYTQNAENFEPTINNLPQITPNYYQQTQQPNIVYNQPQLVRNYNQNAFDIPNMETTTIGYNQPQNYNFSMADYPVSDFDVPSIVPPYTDI